MIRSGLRFVDALLLLAVVTGLFVPWNGFSASVTKGDVAPGWELEDVEGRLVKSSDFSGKVVLMTFFTTTCVPCLWELPDFVDLQERYGEEGLVVVGIGARQSGEVLLPFAEAKGVNYVICPSTDSVLFDYNVLPLGAVPVTVIVDRNGVVADWYLFFHPGSFQEEIIRPLLEAGGAVPVLSVERSGAWLEVSWPAGKTSFVLESRSSYGLLGGWDLVAGKVEVSEGMNRVRIMAEEESEFFRLREGE